MWGRALVANTFQIGRKEDQADKEGPFLTYYIHEDYDMEQSRKDQPSDV
jgi:hypothetical protein